jgi:ribulose-phosphate 3-epimerase
MPEMIGKVEEIRIKLNALHSQAWLEVDGGMTAETIPLMYKAGADVFVAGTAAFKHAQGVAVGIMALRDSIV